MGHFRITDIWPEKHREFIIFKVRFEKLVLDEASWWFPEKLGPIDFEIQPVKQACKVCKIEHKQVYKDEWLCLNDECLNFWKNADGKPGGEIQDLEYNTDFLNCRCQKKLHVPCPLQPIKGVPWVPQPPKSAIDGLGISRKVLANFQRLNMGHAVMDTSDSKQSLDLDCWNWNGFICPRCGRCNSRVSWNNLECGGDCGFQITLPMTKIPLRDVLGGRQGPSTRCAWKVNRLESEISEIESSGSQIEQWGLKAIGQITHIKSTEEINQRPNGADFLFEAFQEEDIGLRRLALTTSEGLYYSWCGNSGLL